MNSLPSTTSLADGIRTIYKQDTANAPSAIEEYLLQQLNHTSVVQRQQVIKDLVTHFAGTQPAPLPSTSFDDDQLLRFCSLLLGHPVEKIDLRAGALQQRLTDALTAIFETLNQLIRTINLTLLEDGQTQETIRFLIGEQLDGSRDTTSLEEHLDQIRTAFVTSHRAFKMAMQITVEKILAELDPDTLTKLDDSSFRFGPMRKADSFDRYGKTFKECRQWFESGRCMEDFLRTFEKQCSTMARNPRR